ncbi:MAG: MqnA/MqnD/SBP family protein [Bacteroidota bacterium]
MLKLAISPCPNDTFIFDAIFHKRIDLEGLEFDFGFHDVETLNRMAMSGDADLIKVSFFTYLQLRHKFELLDSGCAMGFGNGPLLISKNNHSIDDLPRLKVAIPGRYTTAHLLFQVFSPGSVLKEFMTFSNIEDAILRGEVDAGVIIHENRFTYEKRGLKKIADLGSSWEKLTGLPIPLGGIIARKELGSEVIGKLNRIMYRSVRFAMDHPDMAMPFVKQHAQEMDEEVMKKHIRLYVNDQTLQAGPDGLAAIEKLQRVAEETGLMRQAGLNAGSIGKALQSAISKELIRPEDTAVIFYDLSFLEKRLKYLISCFPANTLHGLAIKANPLLKIMKTVQEISPNIGVEAASVGEVSMALKAGYKADQIVYDSPVKTVSDLEFALKSGIHVNIDNFSELERVNRILRDATPLQSGQNHPEGRHPSVGLRINPQVGLGSIKESSVAGEYSKFGVAINNHRQALEHAFMTYPWLTGVHLHVGSQGCPLQMLVDGIGILYDFAMKMNESRMEKGLPPIVIFDIGGGLPIAYHSDSVAPLMADYVTEIGKRAPRLFESFRIFTEFGRWAYTNAGWTASRVEYVKHDPGINTAMLHVGADLFVRECLNPKDWQHEYSVFEGEGSLKCGHDEQPYNLAGPLCFSGDIIAKGVTLPAIDEGDILVIHDSGGYTFSMWSRYNSRQTPRILGYYNDGERFDILKERETLEELHRFWE